MNKFFTLAAFSLSLGFGLCDSALKAGFTDSDHSFLANNIYIDKNLYLTQQSQTDIYHCESLTLANNSDIVINNTKNIENATAIFYANKEMIMNGRILAKNINVELISANASILIDGSGCYRCRFVADSLKIQAKDLLLMKDFVFTDDNYKPVHDIHRKLIPAPTVKGTFSLSANYVELNKCTISAQNVHFDATLNGRSLSIYDTSVYVYPQTFVNIVDSSITGSQLSLNAQSIYLINTQMFSTFKTWVLKKEFKFHPSVGSYKTGQLIASRALPTSAAAAQSGAGTICLPMTREINAFIHQFTAYTSQKLRTLKKLSELKANQDTAFSSIIKPSTLFVSGATAEAKAAVQGLPLGPTVKPSTVSSIIKPSTLFVSEPTVESKAAVHGLPLGPAVKPSTVSSIIKPSTLFVSEPTVESTAAMQSLPLGPAVKPSALDFVTKPATLLPKAKSTADSIDAAQCVDAKPKNMKKIIAAAKQSQRPKHQYPVSFYGKRCESSDRLPDFVVDKRSKSRYTKK